VPRSLTVIGSEVPVVAGVIAYHCWDGSRSFRSAVLRWRGAEFSQKTFDPERFSDACSLMNRHHSSEQSLIPFDFSRYGLEFVATEVQLKSHRFPSVSAIETVCTEAG
jgi:hypothetical protein